VTHDVLCRDLARQVLQWMTDPADAELAAGSCRLIRAFPVALMATLRNDHDLNRGKTVSGLQLHTLTHMLGFVPASGIDLTPYKHAVVCLPWALSRHEFALRCLEVVSAVLPTSWACLCLMCRQLPEAAGALTESSEASGFC
jgi:hypothetical protein